MKGLICAGGEATRLGELTRVTNKHLLPVAGWPMILYPLRLLQLAGIDEVLVVTGARHAGQMIDLLGDGRMQTREASRAAARLDLTYKVQTEAGGIAQVVGMAQRVRRRRQARVRARRQHLRVRAQRRHRRRGRRQSDDAQIFVKNVPDPENFGVVAYDDDGHRGRHRREGGVVDRRYDAPPSKDAVVGSVLLPARRVRRHRRASSPRHGASSRSPT